MSEQEKREDGFYWVKNLIHEDWVAEWIGDSWRVTNTEEVFHDGDFLKIGPRVQRDSEVVRQRDELLAALKAEHKQRYGNTSGIESRPCSTCELIWSIEAEKSGVKP